MPGFSEFESIELKDEAILKLKFFSMKIVQIEKLSLGRQCQEL
jgi:hypothetical protein